MNSGQALGSTSLIIPVGGMDDPTTTAAEGFGLMFYNARWYDTQLGRFAQADTIIPLQSQGTQAWDRYAYVNNNPLKYTDPSGHEICMDTGWCGGTGTGTPYTPPSTGGVGGGGGGSGGNPDGGGNPGGGGVHPSGTNPYNSQPDVSCPENLGFNSQCQVLSASEMEKYYQNVSNVSLVATVIGLGASIVSIAATQIGTGVAVAGFIALAIPVVGIPVGGALMTAGYGIATGGAAASAVVGLASGVVSVETVFLGSAIDSTGAREAGGTVTTSNYIIFQTTTITTKTESAWSFSVSPVTPAILPIQQLWSAISGG